MNAGAVGPGKPEEADGEKNGADNGRRKSSLGGRHAIVGSSHLLITLVVKHVASDGDQHANSDSDKGQPSDAGAPAAALLEHDGEGGEAQIQGAVDDGHVDGGEQDDGLLEQEDPGPHEGNLELGGDGRLGLAGVDLGDVDFARLLGESLGASTKEHRSIRLGNDEGVDDPDDTGEDGHQTLDPAPTLCLTEETTSDRAFCSC